MHESDESPPTRVEAARRRSRVARIGLAAIAAAVFGAGIGLTRANASGHATPGATRKTLRTPPSYLQQLDQSSIQPGTIAPQQTPSQTPPAATSQS